MTYDDRLAHAERRLAQTEELLTELEARSDADNVVLQVIVGQMAAERTDWRDYLERLRVIAEANLRNTTYDGGGAEANLEVARVQLFGRQRIEKMFAVTMRFSAPRRNARATATITASQVGTSRRFGASPAQNAPADHQPGVRNAWPNG